MINILLGFDKIENNWLYHIRCHLPTTLVPETIIDDVTTTTNTNTTDTTSITVTNIAATTSIE